jgi:hypothetical protein
MATFSQDSLIGPVNIHGITHLNLQKENLENVPHKYKLSSLNPIAYRD